MTTPMHESRHAKILQYLVTGKSLIVFEAVPSGHYCLTSTVSTLSNDYGLKFHRQWETVPPRSCEGVRVERYWLADSSMGGAQALLMRWCGDSKIEQPSVNERAPRQHRG